ncbi:hypothetical protein DL93DRAFT_1679106 [Clavulina sp. PMI_390]|nr:hypothetical protein DL93DRAFT_1885925 [Clavulina sp. PMI_390]KAF8309979.1 hypothetical protein DL93DRAFT_1679106 [Clavulina sp. PMI_390]
MHDSPKDDFSGYILESSVCMSAKVTADVAIIHSALSLVRRDRGKLDIIVSMGVWADLPSELAIQVLQNLVPSQKLPEESAGSHPLPNPSLQRELLTCTYVSHQFRAIVTPFLYRDVHLQAAPLREVPGVMTSSPTLHRFACAIILNPHLGKYVRRLSATSLGCVCTDYTMIFESWNKSFSDEEVIQSISTEYVARHDLSTILAAMQDLGLNNGLLFHGGADGIFIVLLHLLPNLESLCVKSGAPLAFIAYSCFSAVERGIPIALQSIVELEVLVKHDEYNEITLGTEELVPFMALPSLRTITAYNFWGRDTPRLQLGTPSPVAPFIPSPDEVPTSLITETPSVYALSAKCSSITELHFRSSAHWCEVLPQVLKLPSRLERFGYEVAEQPFDDRPFVASRLLGGLASQASSLRELHITAQTTDWFWDDDEPFIGSLSGMVALETLRVPLPVLLVGAQAFEDDTLPDGNDENLYDANAWNHLLNDAARITPRNPIDDLLPPNLVSLELDILTCSFTRFIMRTGIPQSLATTRKIIPSLMNVDIIGDPYNSRAVRHILGRTPKLYPAMKFTLFDISNEA